jgi:2'-5' RNA ligase
VLTAIVIAIPEAAPAVDGWRERTCLDRPSIGIPAHVTLIFPFVQAEHVAEEIVADLRALFSATPPFIVAFREARRFPQTLYLVPEPAEPFVRLTESIVERYPDYPPYEGEFDTIIPHLTVAHGDDTLLDKAAAEVGPELPIEAVVREALLLEELEPEWVRWGERARFPLGG